MTLDPMRAQKVPVSILGREFAVACTPNEKAALQHAAKTLDERLKTLRSQGSGAACNFDQLLVVVALNLCNELNVSNARSGETTQPLPRHKLQALMDKIDSALNP
ncbi:cell division protein ZapA [Marinagarivorans algicola]|uniref:cell division protein ZapA n=1 Tax=Marinagarivorans algicola TaxID=1513270 RepID=UPI0006B9C6CA|nr:cell division protein ZapA [Marinagarivorans algicola]